MFGLLLASPCVVTSLSLPLGGKSWPSQPKRRLETPSRRERTNPREHSSVCAGPRFKRCETNHGQQGSASPKAGWCWGCRGALGQISPDHHCPFWRGTQRHHQPFAAGLLSADGGRTGRGRGDTVRRDVSERGESTFRYGFVVIDLDPKQLHVPCLTALACCLLSWSRFNSTKRSGLPVRPSLTTQCSTTRPQ